MDHAACRMRTVTPHTPGQSPQCTDTPIHVSDITIHKPHSHRVALRCTFRNSTFRTTSALRGGSAHTTFTWVSIFTHALMPCGTPTTTQPIRPQTPHAHAHACATHGPPPRHRTRDTHANLWWTQSRSRGVCHSFSHIPMPTLQRKRRVDPDAVRQPPGAITQIGPASARGAEY